MDSTTSATRNPRFTENVDEITSMFDFSGTGNDSSPPHYLQACFLCSKFLGGNSDIFMYRGDLPFCSEDCRKEQIEEDEAREKKIKLSLSSSTKPIKINKNDSTSNSNAASSSSSSSSSTHTSQPLPLLSF